MGPSKVFDLEDFAARQALSATPDRLLRHSKGLVVSTNELPASGQSRASQPPTSTPDQDALWNSKGLRLFDVVQTSSSIFRELYQLSLRGNQRFDAALGKLQLSIELFLGIRAPFRCGLHLDEFATGVITTFMSTSARESSS